MIIEGPFSSFPHENIRCGYSIEAPRRCASIEYPQLMFSCRNKQKHLLIIAKIPMLISLPDIFLLFAPIDVKVKEESVYIYTKVSMAIRSCMKSDERSPTIVT